MSLTVYILDYNENSRKILKMYLEELGIKNCIKDYGNYLEAFNEIKTDNEKDSIIFVDLSEISNDDLNLVKDMKLYTQKLVFTSINCSTDLIIISMRMGAE